MVSAGKTDADRQWDQFVSACSLGHHEQSSGYGVSRASFGYRCERVIVRDGGRIVAGAQVLIGATPIGKVGLVFRGPISLDDDPRWMREVVAQLDELGRSGACASIRADCFPSQKTALAALAEAGFEPSVSWERSRVMTSVIVPLHDDEDELLRGMHKKVAYNVRRSRRLGVFVRSGDEASVEDFYRLHQATACHQGFPVFSQSYFSYVDEVFGLNGKTCCFIAYGEGEPRAAIMNTIVGDQMYYGWGGMLRDADSKRFRANFLLHVEAMKWAAQRGCTRYDFVGSQPFKRWFGSETVAWPKPLRKFYGPLSKLRRTMLEATHANSSSRQLITRVGRRLRLVRPMPW
ncbi:MAG: peptidoglycan bridge formation glycyltransferase FemA/FemB family protein [Gammaproteobacteria bacterium]|nr:peptidoglycan bridge formation glycyltransferase FemA/FemB family protein [Gammaproteobacteria bacterium]